MATYGRNNNQHTFPGPEFKKALLSLLPKSSHICHLVLSMLVNKKDEDEVTFNGM